MWTSTTSRPTMFPRQTALSVRRSACYGPANRWSSAVPAIRTIGAKSSLPNCPAATALYGGTCSSEVAIKPLIARRVAVALLVGAPNPEEPDGQRHEERDRHDFHANSPVTIIRH